MPQEKAFLVIAGSGIGNVLLATPIVRSLRRACPGARIDVLVPRGRGEVLCGNPDVRTITEAVRDSEAERRGRERTGIVHAVACRVSGAAQRGTMQHAVDGTGRG
jgi:ADP-heptose:LPS heptosyltransferase